MASAVSSYDCCNSLVNIVVDGRDLDNSAIAMGVDIDKSGTDKKTCRIDRFPCSLLGQVSDLSDSFSVDPDIALKPRISGPVQDKTIFDQESKILFRSKAFKDKKENK
jgi:hypothetical protein